MRIAIPVAQGQLALHFGHCAQFALVDTDPAAKTILKTELVDAPPHEPGLLPRWLGEQGAKVILAGGMGARAQALFAESGIEVVIGAPAEEIETLVLSYLNGRLESGGNICDH
ncbi:MAG: ATPase [Candidatus Hydrogenedens sp.]|jgi:predicted Fe-Mo cluster-binding NifX family protein|nr:ATPase [Candidatus Hydrogenedens sp.]